MGPSKYKQYTGTSTGPYEQQMADIASKEYEATAPLRTAFMEDWGKMLEGEMPSVTSPMFGALRKPVEEQYQVGRENILSELPKGGVLDEALANLESERAGTLSDIMANIWMDQINKAYGYATGVPQTTISGLGGAASSMAQRQAAALQSSAQAAQGIGSFCCFNFLAAEGEIHEAVRMYRDEHYPKTGDIGRGYKYTASVLVPLMREYRWFKYIIRTLMTRPLKNYAQWYYGQNKWGFILWPAKTWWVELWRFIGRLRRK